MIRAGGSVAEPSPIEVHKALADDTRYRLYRYLRLSGRPVSVRELSIRLGLHVNTLRPHLRRLEEAGLITSEAQRGVASVGRPQTVYSVVDREEREGRDYRLFAEIVAGHVTGARQRSRAVASAREWGAYLVGERRRAGRPPPAVRTSRCCRRLSEAGFDPRFRRRGQCGWTSRCATARSAISSTSTATWCANCTVGCSRACLRAPGRRCAWTRSSPWPIARRLPSLGRARLSLRDRTYRPWRTAYSD